MSRENDRRDKALEDIARELRQTNKHLKALVDHKQQLAIIQPIDVNLLKDLPTDPFNLPQEPQPGKGENAELLNPYGPKSNPGFPQSTNPYFKRSEPNGTG